MKLFIRSKVLTLKFIMEELLIKIRVVKYLIFILFYPITFITLLFMILKGEEEKN